MSIAPLLCPSCKEPIDCIHCLLYHTAQQCQTEKHKKQREEYDMGIVHSWRCKLAMIEVPRLIINPEVAS